MKGIAFFLVFAFVGVLLLKLFAAKGGQKEQGRGKDGKLDLNQPWPYRLKGNVLSEPEQTVFWNIHTAMPDHLVLAQVAMSSVVVVPTRQHMDYAWRAKIDRKSLDYLVCLKDGSAVVAIELDDSTHKGREQKDEDKDRALKAAGLPILRWHVSRIPSPEEIKRQVAPILMAKQQSDQRADRHGLNSVRTSR